MQWRGVRRPSVPPSVNFLRKSLLLSDKWADIATKLAHDGPQESTSRVCSSSRSRWKVTRYKRIWNFTKKSLTQYFHNFSFPLFIRFSSASQSPNGCEFALLVTSLIAHIVKQFVRLMAIQYGQIFCLYVRSLSTIALSFSTKCQAARSNVYLLEWDTPSMTVWLLIFVRCSRSVFFRVTA